MNGDKEYLLKAADEILKDSWFGTGWLEDTNTKAWLSCTIFYVVEDFGIEELLKLMVRSRVIGCPKHPACFKLSRLVTRLLKLLSNVYKR